MTSSATPDLPGAGVVADGPSAGSIRRRYRLPSTFAGRIAVVLGCAALVRVVQALTIAPPLTFLYDDTFFKVSSQLLGTGHGYIRPLDFFFKGTTIPTAEHPPLYPLFLSILPALGIDGLDAARMFGVAFGTGTVLVVALIARRVAGDRAGLWAGGLCAAYPSFIAADGSIFGEPLFGLLVGLAVLQALRLRTRPTLKGSAALGVLVGLAALTRSEGVLLLPLLGIPAVVAVPRQRLMKGAVVVLGTLVVLAPWVARNWHVFGRPTLSTDQGPTVAGSNCHSTYYGPNIGGFNLACSEAIPLASRHQNEALWSEALTDRGLDYAARHPARAVLVAVVREARLWGLYQPTRQGHVPGRRVWVQQIGVAVYYAVAVLALVGLVSLRRPKIEKYLLLTPVLVSSIVGLTAGFDLRVRYEAEVMLLVFAGIAVATRLQVRSLRDPAAPSR